MHHVTPMYGYANFCMMDASRRRAAADGPCLSRKSRERATPGFYSGIAPEEVWALIIFPGVVL
jgi:hypothetical protein